MTGVLDALETAPPPSRRRFARWAAQEPVLASLRAADVRRVLLDDTPPVDYDRRDDLLAALIRLSKTDEAAGTLLVACLLPGLRAKLARHGWGLEVDEAAATAVAALWQRIWTYPLVRRPRKIAMNLLWDTTHDLITVRDKELDHKANSYLTRRRHDRPDPGADGLTEGIVWDSARRAGVLNDREIALIRSTRVHDIPITDVAPLLGMRHETARKARQRALHKLRTWMLVEDRVA